MGSSLLTTPIIEQTDLTPCDPKEALRLLGPLFRNLASDRKFDDTPRGESDRREAMAVYVRPLTKEPAWAIELAVTRFLDGTVDRHKSRVGWVPKSDEFAQEVRRLTDWPKEQKHRRQRLAKAAPAADTLHEKMGPEARAVVDRFLRKSRELQQEDAK